MEQLLYIVFLLLSVATACVQVIQGLKMSDMLWMQNVGSIVNRSATIERIRRFGKHERSGNIVCGYLQATCQHTACTEDAFKASQKEEYAGRKEYFKFIDGRQYYSRSCNTYIIVDDCIYDRIG